MQRDRSSRTFAFASVALAAPALFVLGTFVAGCAGSDGGNTAGTTGAAGMNGTGGAAGTTSAAGNGGSTAGGSGGATVGTGGTGGATSVGTGGSGGATVGTGGTGGGAAGATGGAAGNAGGSTGATTMVDPSPGCNLPPGATDSQKVWVQHDLTVTGVDPTFIAQHAPNAGTMYSWTHRNYFLRLPTGYNVAKPYPVTIGMSGCGGSETVGLEGGYAPLGTGAGETQAIQVSLSYVLSTAANSDCNGAVFADDFVNSPDPPYVEAVIKDLEANYCVDRARVFVSGYSSGAFEAITLGCTDADILRSYAIQIGGGLRLHHPPCKTHPIAAMYVVGLQDVENPIGPLMNPLHDTLGSAPARDEVLARNGCMGMTTAPWDAAYPLCVKYMGCPEKYPVVWCPITSGHQPAMTDPLVNKYRYDAIWKFWSTLP